MAPHVPSVAEHPPASSFPEPPGTRAPKLNRPSGRHRSLPTVLVVEDDALVRSFMRGALEGIAAVVEAPDGEHALQVLAQHGRSSFDLVLLDHILPKQSGLDVLRFMRLQWPWIPVVLFTGFGSEDLAIQALRAGARDYLRKPIAPDQLRRTVATLTAAPASGPHARPEPIMEHGADAATPAAPPTHRGIRRALAFAAEHFTEAITLSDIAREASLSRFHFCRLFRQETGLRFREYLQHLRVRQARTLLADPSLTVTEVAYAAGFNDLSTFDKVFKRIVGAAPSEYRKALLSL